MLQTFLSNCKIDNRDSDKHLRQVVRVWHLSSHVQFEALIIIDNGITKVYLLSPVGALEGLIEEDRLESWLCKLSHIFY